MENIIQGKAKGKPTKQDKEWWKILKWAWEGHGQGMGRVRAGLQILQKYQIDSVGIDL